MGDLQQEKIKACREAQYIIGAHGSGDALA